MIRLVCPQISQQIVFKENIINSLVIENSSFFYDFISDLYKQTQDISGSVILSDDFVPVSISKNVELITQFVPFEINKKSLLNKICSSMEKTAIDESNFAKTQQLLASIETFFYDITMDYPCNLSCSNLSVNSIIKMLGITVTEEDCSLCEKTLDYMELVREYDKDKIFIFANMRNYISEQMMFDFSKSILSKKYSALFIDNCDNKKFDFEKRITIDNDLCEI